MWSLWVQHHLSSESLQGETEARQIKHQIPELLSRLQGKDMRKKRREKHNICINTFIRNGVPAATVWFSWFLGVSLSDECFLSLQQFLCASSHTSKSGENTERKVDPLHFLVTQLQSLIPQEVLGLGPAVNRDTEFFHMWIVGCHAGVSALLA